MEGLLPGVRTIGWGTDVDGGTVQPDQSLDPTVHSDFNGHLALALVLGDYLIIISNTPAQAHPWDLWQTRRTRRKHPTGSMPFRRSFS